jgi:DNA-binding transcriptional LysR family regulator
VAFVTGTPSVPECEAMQFWTERMFVVLPQDHALCSEDEIEWEAIRDEHFILRRSDIIKRLAVLGYHPKVVRL